MSIRAIMYVVVVAAMAFSQGIAALAGANTVTDEFLEKLRVPDEVDWSLRFVISSEAYFQVVIINKRWDGAFEFGSAKLKYGSPDAVRAKLDNCARTLRAIPQDDPRFKKQLSSLSLLERLTVRVVPSSDITLHSQGMRIVAATRVSQNVIELVQHEDTFQYVMGLLRDLGTK